MAKYISSTDSSNNEAIEGGYSVPPSHYDIAMATTGTKYRLPYEYADDLPDDKGDSIKVDGSGNNIDVYGATAWAPLDEAAVLDMFSELNDFRDGTDRVEWDKLDYEIYGEDYYRERFPNFPEEWYNLLVQASKDKYKDLQTHATKGLTRTEGDFTIKFD